MKKIPYGIANFEKISAADTYYFVDKTRYIQTLEELGSAYLFFLRPRRFGKSLFLSVLEHYYDINRRDQFEELFGSTYIGAHPTPLRNSLPILKLNFSGIPTDRDMEQIQRSFDLLIAEFIEGFLIRYQSYIQNIDKIKDSVLKLSNATDMLRHFIFRLHTENIKYYLLIDEYDNFANNILIHHGRDRYSGVTHRSGFLRSFFAAIKNATETRTVERMFVTGVTPLVLSDVTSGMNIGDNLSASRPFNAMLGFTPCEVDAMLDYYIGQRAVKAQDRAEIRDIMAVNYNHYCFCENTGERVYNSDMVLYFFNKYFQNQGIPGNLIDENARTDFGKLRFLIIESRKLNGNFDILTEILEKNRTDATLSHSFAIADIIKHNKFKSFLYYLGLLTIHEFSYGSEFTLTIPNETVKTMHFEYIRQALTESYAELRIDIDYLRAEFKRTAFEGRWEKLFGYILDMFYEAASIRDFIYREEGIKMFMLAYLNITPLYFVESEPEMNRGFADIFFRKNYFTTDLTKYEYLIELKYLKAGEKGKQNPSARSPEEPISRDAIEKIRLEALAQLERYALSRHITCPLKKIVIICASDKLLLMEEIQ